jgi:hypothetical protein
LQEPTKESQVTEKRVSVRLAAVGGRQVRAELEGVGEAGSRGFGRLSREVEAANTRLAAFSRRVAVVGAAAVAAAVATGASMIRSGLQTVDAQAKLAASLGTTVKSIQVLERVGYLAGVSMGQVEQATVQLTRRLSQAASGTGPAVDALRRLRLAAEDLRRLPLDERIAAIQDALGRYVPEAKRAAVASQLFGDRAALVFTRIDTAPLRQATADVQDFGVVVSDQDARQIERTNDAISRLGLIWRGLSNQLAVAAAPALEAVVNAMAAMARTTGTLGIGIKALFDNIGRLTTVAATFAGIMAVRWVAGLVAAALSVRGLATALVVLRGALTSERITEASLVFAGGARVLHHCGSRDPIPAPASRDGRRGNWPGGLNTSARSPRASARTAFCDRPVRRMISLIGISTFSKFRTTTSASARRRQASCCWRSTAVMICKSRAPAPTTRRMSRMDLRTAPRNAALTFSMRCQQSATCVASSLPRRQAGP